MNIFLNITKAAVFVILAVQAYSDYKTKELYAVLTFAAMGAAAPAMVMSIDLYDMAYVLTAAAFILLQSSLGAYAIGDAKLYIAALELIAIDFESIDIWISFLFLEMCAIIIFAAYVFIPKALRGEKLSLREGHAYAPAIFTAYLISIFVQDILSI